MFMESVPHSPFPAIAPPLLGCSFSYLILSNVYRICSSLPFSCYCPSPSWLLLLSSYPMLIESVPHSPFPAIAPPLLGCSFSYLILSNVYRICSSLPFSCYCPSPSWLFLLLSYPMFIKSVLHSAVPAIAPPLLCCFFSYLIQCS